ncbi:hypothetical protein A6A28_22515 [Streptomyces sp. CB03578]|nr:hypothetical protein A6A28_22515 [Streptomyces sp. CB03578]
MADSRTEDASASPSMVSCTQVLRPSYASASRFTYPACISRRMTLLVPPEERLHAVDSAVGRSRCSGAPYRARSTSVSA